MACTEKHHPQHAHQHGPNCGHTATSINAQVCTGTGCKSPVIAFTGDSDAHIVRGLVAIMLALFSGRTASEIQKTDAEATLKTLGLDEHLSPQRANGLRSMVKRIKRDAEAALKQTA